jgi:hypothetical protein
VAARFAVARKTVHDWLANYEAGGPENLGDRSHRPRSCPHQMGSDVEAEAARLRTAHPSWDPRRLAFELSGQDLAVPVPSESAVCRALLRLNLIDPGGRRRRDRKYRRLAVRRRRRDGMRRWLLYPVTSSLTWVCSPRDCSAAARNSSLADSSSLRHDGLTTSVEGLERSSRLAQSSWGRTTRQGARPLPLHPGPASLTRTPALASR